MNYQQIWQILQQLIGHLGDPTHWKVSKDGKAIGPVTSVLFNTTDAKLGFTDEGSNLVLEAKPGTADHADIYVNGVRQDAARMVVALKSQFPSKPLIVVLIFKHVTVGSAIHDYRFDNPA